MPYKYILCYFLNYTFNAYPYVNDLAKHIQRLTGYKLLIVGRPPQNLSFRNIHYKIDINPIEFVSLIKNASLVLTTSFHGTVFAANLEVPFYSIVNEINGLDSRQQCILEALGLEHRLIDINTPFPTTDLLNCNFNIASQKMKQLRSKSISFLQSALTDN